MAKFWLEIVVLTLCIFLVKGQLVCPKCLDKYDHDSCTDTQTCGVGWNYCELQVHTSDFYSIEYTCQYYEDCVNHELYGCKPEVNETCYYCCEDELTCNLQREDLFEFVFPNVRPPTSPTSTTPPPITQPGGGVTFDCPYCTNPYDYTTCTGVLQCSVDLFDYCELDVHTRDHYRIEYSCQRYTDCTNHEVFGCRPQQNEVCTYCCSDLAQCKLQRDDLFEYVFIPDPITWAPEISNNRTR